jgi:hypothetical protein
MSVVVLRQEDVLAIQDEMQYGLPEAQIITNLLELFAPTATCWTAKAREMQFFRCSRLRAAVPED